MLTLAEARARITTSLGDDDLTDAIERQEAWLARRIGPLSGSRTETFVTEDGDEVLQLQRPTTLAAIAAVDEGGTVDDLELRGWSDLVRTSSWQGTVDVAYEPDDDAEVREAIITLVRLAVTESTYASEAWQGYSATVDHDMRRRMRWEAWRSLLRQDALTTTRLKSAIPAGGNSIASVQVTADGS